MLFKIPTISLLVFIIKYKTLEYLGFNVDNFSFNSGSIVARGTNENYVINCLRAIKLMIGDKWTYIQNLSTMSIPQFHIDNLWDTVGRHFGDKKYLK